MGHVGNPANWIRCHILGSMRLAILAVALEAKRIFLLTRGLPGRCENKVSWCHRTGHRSVA